MIPRIVAASNEAGAQGLSITENMFMKAMSGFEAVKDAVTGQHR
jgi:hypothetical protein